MSYSELVAAHFREPQCVGVLDTPGAVQVRCGSVASGALLNLSALLSTEGQLNVRFQAYGCPYTIACASYACANFTDRAPSEGRDALTESELVRTLQIPAGKRHSAALVVQAWQQLMQQLSA